MGEIDWPITMMVHFVPGERDASPLPELTDLVIGSDENGKYLYAWPADSTKTMLDLKAGDVLVFKITSSYVIDYFSTMPPRASGQGPRFSSVQELLDHLESK
jgi:hypothetical protein